MVNIAWLDWSPSAFHADSMGGIVYRISRTLLIQILILIDGICYFHCDVFRAYGG